MEDTWGFHGSSREWSSDGRTSVGSCWRTRILVHMRVTTLWLIIKMNGAGTTCCPISNSWIGRSISPRAKLESVAGCFLGAVFSKQLWHGIVISKANEDMWDGWGASLRQFAPQQSLCRVLPWLPPEARAVAWLPLPPWPWPLRRGLCGQGRQNLQRCRFLFARWQATTWKMVLKQPGVDHSAEVLALQWVAGCPGVIQLHGSLDTPTHLVLLLDFCEGGAVWCGGCCKLFAV